MIGSSGAKCVKEKAIILAQWKVLDTTIIFKCDFVNDVVMTFTKFNTISKELYTHFQLLKHFCVTLVLLINYN